ncbi:LysR substrate-binding domain-containing protein [Streptomyces showdoensis]|uniref:LysR substrate-binding domain-containing protein n=1 Tax=Streptomyces showdoensis TaxID=68268 RepID=UPI000F4E70BE|nr:LysR substrate-binding domain-containing protein [Streptomyces showdoensis]
MSRPDLPPLNTLLPFEATVRHASMTRAAQELHVTHGAVSRQVQNLEKALGTPLFERGPRSLRPTPQARRLAAAVREALDLVEAAAVEASGRERSGPLALSCEPTLLMRWLIPRLPDLAVRLPELTVHLSAGGGPVAFARDTVDAAVRRDDFPVPEGVSRVPLFEEWIGPVCRPELAARLTGGEPVPLLHTSTRPTAWDDWRRLSGSGPRGAGEQTFEHFYLALQAAVAGVGVAIGPYALVRDDLERGQLAAPYGFVADGTGYGLLSPRPPERDTRTAALLGWLREQAAALVPPPGERRERAAGPGGPAASAAPAAPAAPAG